MSISPSEMWISMVVRNSSIGALCFLVYDICITFDDEVSFIWTLPRNYLLKWLFLYLRYFSVVAQMVHRLKVINVKTPYPSPQRVCVPWYIFELWSTESLIVPVEIILMIRVYLLYNRDGRMAAILSLLLVFQLVFMVLTMVYTIPRITFTAYCIESVAPKTLIYFVSGVLGSNSAVLIFTLYKCSRFIRLGRGRTPLVTLLIRDGSWAFAGLFSITVVNVIVYGVVGKSLSTIGTPWTTSILATAGCRIIINMEHLAAKERRNETTTIELTTNVFGISDEIQTA